MKQLLFSIIFLFVPMLSNAEFVEINGIYYYLNNSDRTAEVFPREEHYSGEVIIPDYVFYNGYSYPVVAISNRAFFECRDMTSVTIGNYVTVIDGHSFYNCFGLTSIILPNSVKEIGGDAFSGCTNLRTIIIGSGLTYIYLHAFRDCKNLKKFYCLAKNVPEIRTNNSYNAFSNFPIEDATLYVPEESVWLYKTDSHWNDFGTIVGLKVNTIEEILGITPVLNNVKESLHYMLDGKRFHKAQKGINIIKMSDGTTKKKIAI